MRALAVRPGVGNSAHLREMQEPSTMDGDILCRMVATGICGTDRDLIRGEYGTAPKSDDYLIIGHEALGQVVESPPHSGFSPGDLVVPIVRRPDPIPCPSCAGGEWDMCENGKFTERGIQERHGFAADLFRIESAFCVPIDKSLSVAAVLIEPASIVAKAWEQTLRILNRSTFKPNKVLVAGAGPIGLLAAMMGKQYGYEVHVIDQVERGLKPNLVRELGASYHPSIESALDTCEKFELMFECTGVVPVIIKLMNCISRNGILCLTGVSTGSRTCFNIGQLNREIVLENEVIFGSVNANRRHFELAAQSLMKADSQWLAQLVTRKVPLERWQEAFELRDDDVKVVLTSSTEV